MCPIEDGGFRDPYVRLLLEPEVDKRKRQTLIHRGETNPYFDQHFKFPVSRDQLQGKELILQVLDYDRYSHNDIIGEVRICIDELDLSKSVEVYRFFHFSIYNNLISKYLLSLRSGEICCAPKSRQKIVLNCFVH